MNLPKVFKGNVGNSFPKRQRTYPILFQNLIYEKFQKIQEPQNIKWFLNLIC